MSGPGPPWKRVVSMAAILAVLIGTLPFQRTLHEVFFELAGVLAIYAIVLGVQRHQPANRRIWYGLAGTVAIFLVSFGLRLLFPVDMAPVHSGAPRPADYLDMFGLFVAVATMYEQGRIRDDRSDPTTVIDSGIIAGGVSTMIWLLQVNPAIKDPHLALSGRILTIFMAVQLIWLSFCAIRLLLTSRTRNAASMRLNIAVAFAVLAGLSAVGTKTPINNELLTFAGIALWSLGSAALVPSMKELTAPGNRDRRWIPTGKMTPKRIVVATPALLIAPAALLFEIATNRSTLPTATYLILSWGVVTAFVMLRLAGLMRVREQWRRADHVLMEAASSLVSSKELSETYRVATATMLELTSIVDSDVLVAIATVDEAQWMLADAMGRESQEVDGKTFDDELMQSVIGGDRTAEQKLAALLRPNSKKTPIVLVVPLTSQSNIRGALIVLNSKPLSVITVDALRSLATNVTLAIEATALAESLHQRRSDHRFRSLVEKSPDIILVVASDDTITFLSPSAERFFGAKSLNIISLTEFIHPDDRLVLAALLERARGHGRSERVENFEFRVLDRGDVRWFEATATNLFDDETVNGVVVNARDITERKLLEQDLRFQVLHDDLTGIANRALFRDRLDHALLARREADEHVAVLFVDLDDFKTVNDALGHDTGDELLKIVAFRLERSIRVGDVASRLGGDEFAVLLKGLDTVEAVMTAATRLLSAVIEPVEFGGRELTVTASIGVAIAEENMLSEVLLRNADVAMYHSKQTGKNRIKLFDQAMFLSAFERLEMKVELEHVLERQELSLHYQPLIDLHDNHLIGFEALLRWTHPTLNMVPPGSFVPLVEETGAIMDIGAWALREACKQLATWTRIYGKDVFMSVNVSPRQLDEDRIVDDVRNAIEESGINPAQLTLELTESAGLEDPMSRERLIALRALGCCLAADDFGTGFASYAALQQLPFTDVKIDRSLITGLSRNDERAIVQVRSIIEMGHALGLIVTAEGIEDVRQSAALLEMGADRGQGYMIGRPDSAINAAEYLRKSPLHNPL